MSLNGTESKVVLIRRLQHDLDTMKVDIVVGPAADKGFKFYRRIDKTEPTGKPVVPLFEVSGWQEACITIVGIEMGVKYGI